MRKKIFPVLFSLWLLCGLVLGSAVTVSAEEPEPKLVDGSYLTADDSSDGYSWDDTMRGVHLMDGMSSITKAGFGKIYVYGATTANHYVDYVAVILYVERYNEEYDDWDYVDSWMAEAEDTYYINTSDTLKVETGYYYRVRCYHFAGNKEYDENGNRKPYDETFSFTNGIMIDR